MSRIRRHTSYNGDETVGHVELCGDEGHVGPTILVDSVDSPPLADVVHRATTMRGMRVAVNNALAHVQRILAPEGVATSLCLELLLVSNPPVRRVDSHDAAAILAVSQHGGGPVIAEALRLYTFLHGDRTGHR